MWTVRLAALLLGVATPLTAIPFQIAPLGSKFEARLTNETESRIAWVAGAVGKLIKEPVHEEITQLGFGCPADRENLATDNSCMGGDMGFATSFVIYGVRWNDLPPFRLGEGQGANCRKLGILNQPACITGQTVRFSTQPDCWYCLFKQAEQKAINRKITGCERGPGYEQGTLMTRSHFGDLQFLHAMASAESASAESTRARVLDWIQFAWRVFSKELRPEQLLRTIDIPTIQQHFGCSDWTVSDLYILGQKDKLLPQLDNIAFGSILHTVQDSFAAGHASREPSSGAEQCPTSPLRPRPGRIIEFHTYGAQDGAKHDEQDARSAMTATARSRWPDAVEATRNLFELWNDNARWDVARPYIECLFELSPANRPSSPGEAFRRVAQ